MDTKKLLFIGFFALVVVAQWFIPLQMITEQEDILNTGKLYKFKTAPVDPYDAFRGKYIHLNYANTEVKVTNNEKFTYEDDVFVRLKDSSGYALIQSVSKKEPNSGDYVKARVSYSNTNNFRQIIGIYYPFDRFYMNENKAKSAETAYAEANQQPNQTTYALVAVKNGKAVIKDVLINNISVRVSIKTKHNNQK
jgi:uncharacterized membrane-anchored protein